MQESNARPDPNVMPAPPAPKSRRGLIIAAVLVGLVVMGGGFVTMIGGIMKSSDAYKDAMTRAAADCRVEQAIGAPLSAGYFVSGSVETSGPSGHADLAIPVAGSTGQGTLYVLASRSAGVWSFQQLRLDVDGGQAAIDLLASVGNCEPGAAAPSDGSGSTAKTITSESVPQPAAARPAPAPASGVAGKEPSVGAAPAARPAQTSTIKQ